MHAIVALSREPKLGVRPFGDALTKRGRYQKHSYDYVSRFYKLVRRWRAETAYISSSDDLFDHPAFIEVVGMGRKAIPLIVGELRRQPDLLLVALSRITGENPVAQSDRGDIYAMSTAWVEWFQRRYR